MLVHVGYDRALFCLEALKTFQLHFQVGLGGYFTLTRLIKAVCVRKICRSDDRRLYLLFTVVQKVSTLMVHTELCGES